jgi:signal peptidase I
MTPAIPEGSRLLIEPAGKIIQKGEIVLFSHGSLLVAHRVISISDMNGELRIQTRGDGCAEPDYPISPNQLIGLIAHCHA